jgi:hypothetical protein
VADGSRLKVALLARAGEAREQLKRAITDLGAELVVEADPNDLSAGALASAGATAVLVSVEPAVEAALDRLDDELLAPALNVMYDEAETTSKLQGWDLARWARHLAAKLVGCDVLPPGAEPEAHQEAAEHLVPGVPTTPAAMASEARMADFAEEINASAADVPSAYRPSDAPVAADAAPAADAPPSEPVPPAEWVTPPVEEGDPELLDLDLAALEQAMQVPAPDAPNDAGRADSAPAAFAVSDDVDVGMIDLRGLELVDDADDAIAERPAQPSVSLLSAREISFDATPAGGAEALEMDVEELTLSDEELAAFGESGGFRFATGESEPAGAGGAGLDSGDDALTMDPELAKLAASFDENLDSLTFEGASDDDEFAAFDRRESALELGARGDAPLEPARARAEPPPIPDFGFADGAYVDAAKPAVAPLPDTSGLSLSAEDAAPLAAPAPVAKPSFDFTALDSLELAPIDDVPAVAPPPAPVVDAPPAVDVAHLSLSPIADQGDGPSAPSGMVLVLSGIGGPDAVRQMVRALPAGFPLAVLLQQNLDGGRHDRFVEQLAKISRLPVALAEPTETPPPNAVRVLPEGLSGAGALSFPKAEGVAALIAATTAQDGAVVVLSGADEAVVEPLKQAMANGTRVLVQDPSSCFDAKAIVALQAAGASPVAASDIAARLDAYFPT